jgi:hypothetical protein
LTSGGDGAALRASVSYPTEVLVMVSLGLLLVGCEGPSSPPYTEDVRIDGASAAGDPDSFGTRMCTAPDGTVYVLWLDDREQPGEEIYDIWMNRSLLDTERTWLPSPVRVNHGDGSVWKPDLHCSEEGVFVVWEDDRDGELHNRGIYFNRSVDQGATFLAEDISLDVDPEGVTVSYEPQIVGNGTDLFVVWYDDKYGAYDIQFTQSSTLGEVWSGPQRVESDEPGNAYSAHPQIAVSDDSQDIWVVWEDSRDGGSDIWFAASDDGGVSFEEDVRLDGGDEVGSHDSFEPKLCTDGSDHVYAVWHDSRNGAGHDIFVNYSPNGGAYWGGEAIRVETDTAGLGDSLSPVCVADGSKLQVVWTDKVGETFDFDIFLRELESGIPSDDPVRLDAGRTEGHSRSMHPQISMDLDNVVVAWLDGRGALEQGTDPNYDDLYYNYALNGGPFASDADFRIDSMIDGGSSKTDLNIDVLGGTLHAAWTDGRDGSSNVYFQSMPIGTQSKAQAQEEER